MFRYRLSAYALAFALIAHTALGQTTSFTYQGRLSDGNAFANGTYDIQFKLFDAPGNQVGSTFTNPAVSVVNGIFTVSLDFGSSSFPGADRLLEIGVRPAGSANPYTVLSPRQPFTSTPYAIQALKAASADALSSACVGCALTVTGAGSYQNTDTFAGVGAGISTTPGVSGAGDLNSFFGVNAGHLNTTGPENTFVGADAGYNNLTGQGNSFFGDFAGNSNTNGNNNSFFGSGAGYSSNAFGNSLFGQQSGNNNSSGANNSFVGIQTGLLNTQGSNNTFLGAYAGLSNTIGGNNTLVGSGTNVGTNNLINATAIGANAMVSQSNSLVLGAIKNINGATADTNVGIGTATPGSLLTVSSNTASLAVSISNAGSGNALSAGSTGGVGVSGTSGNASAAGVYGENNAGGYGVLGISNQSNGGVGVTGVKGVSNGGSGLTAQTTFTGVWGDAGTNSVGLLGTANNGWGLIANCTSCSSTGAAWFQGGKVVVDNGMTVGGLVNFTNFVFLQALGGGGSQTLCRNGSNQIGTCSSSLRYKTNVAPFAGGLDVINRLRPIRYEWKDGGAHDLGLAAEEVEKVEPLLTFRNEAGQVEGVKYDRLAAVFINAFKEQQEQIKRQQSQIDSLKELVCREHPQASVCK